MMVVSKITNRCGFKLYSCWFQRNTIKECTYWYSYIASSGGGGGGTLADGSVTTAKLADSAVTSAKLDKNVVDSFITAGSNVTLTKDSGTGIVTIASSGGGGGGGGGSGGTINAVQGFYSVDPSTNVVDPLNTNIGVGYNSLIIYQHH